MSVVIPGIGTVPVSSVEYTSGAVIKKYLDNLAIIQQVFNKQPAGSVNEQDVINLLNAVQNLADLLKNGVVSGTPPLQNFLLRDLAVKLSAVLQSLNAVGINATTQLGSTPADVQNQIRAIGAWQNLASAGVAQIISDAAAVGPSPTRTLQSMIELEFVKQGNDIIFGQLSNLESALRTTQSIMDTLNTVLGISNQIQTPVGGNLELPPLIEDASQFAQIYKNRAEFLFQQGKPIPNPTATSAQQLLAARDLLASKLADLEKSSGTTRDQPNTLAFFVNQVVKDIDNAFTNVDVNNPSDAMVGVGLWIMDNQDAKVGSAGGQQSGAIHDNILQSISTGQSLNDTQKEDVNRLLFLFQEFYKSSSTMLETITQIIEKIAQNANR